MYRLSRLPNVSKGCSRNNDMLVYVKLTIRLGWSVEESFIKDAGVRTRKV